MLDIFFAQLIKRYGHFSRLGVEIALSHRHVEKTLIFSGEMNTAIHGLNEDVRPLLNQHTGVAAQMMC